MKVNRRTVWLLTLFSLAAVISVYYYAPVKPFDGLAIFTDAPLNETVLSGVSENTDETKMVTSESPLFEGMRMEMMNERSQLREQYTQKIASDQYTAEEKNEAFTEMQKLIKQESNEAMVEMLIRSLGYSDALVRTDGQKVAVTVMADELSAVKANEIVYLVRTELENVLDVSVNFKSSSY